MSHTEQVLVQLLGGYSQEVRSNRRGPETIKTENAQMFKKSRIDLDYIMFALMNV